MTPRKYFNLIVILFLIFVQLAASAKQPSGDAAWDKYLSSQKKMQVAYHHLIHLHAPQLESTIKKSRELQLAYADQKNIQFYDLLKFEPSRIVRDQGFSPFVNFEWQEADEIRLQNNSDYRKLLKRIAKMKAELEKDPQYPEIQNRLHGLENEREFIEIQARFRFVSKEVEALLNQNPSAGDASGNMEIKFD